MRAAAKIILYHDDIIRLDEIKNFIDQNFNHELHIKSLSEKFTISKSTLIRHFRSCYDVSISGYILKCRMSHAMTLLTTHAIPISQIGITVGYQDRSAFTHAFTKFFGKPPAFYLRKTIGDAEVNQLTT